MSDGTLVVNFAALQQASTDIQMAINTMTSQLGQLESDAAPLVSTWDGAARAAYQQRQAIWRRAAEDLSAMLTEIRVSVDQSAADYDSTERRNTSMFR
jgi:WXG100 family type VII secretion target